MPKDKSWGLHLCIRSEGFQDPKTGETISGIEAQTKQCLENMKQVLETAGSSLDDVVKVTVFLGSVADYAR